MTTSACLDLKDQSRAAEKQAVLKCLAELGDPILAEVRRKELTLRQAAEVFFMSEKRTRRLLERHFDEFSANTMIRLLHRIGLRVASVRLVKEELAVELLVK